MTPYKNKRERYTKMGQETIQRVIQHILRDITPTTNAFLTTQHVEINTGTWYKPDIEIWLQNKRYGVEVKGMQNSWKRTSDGYRRTSKLKLPRTQWNNLEIWCSRHTCRPLLIIEIKTRCHRVPYLYFKLDKQAIEKLKAVYPKEWLSASIWEIINLGEKL